MGVRPRKAAKILQLTQCRRDIGVIKKNETYWVAECLFSPPWGGNSPPCPENLEKRWTGPGGVMEGWKLLRVLSPDEMAKLCEARRGR